MSKLLLLQRAPRHFRYLSSRKSDCDAGNHHKCKVLVVGGGSGGCAVAAKLSKNLKKNELIILEPSDDHYYQPLFTLIGGGMNTVADARRNTKDVLPKKATWLKDSAVEFNPQSNSVTTAKDHTIEYDYLLVATGLQLNFEKIPGLVEGLKDKDSGICTNYSPKYTENVYRTLQKFNEGNAIFTFPSGPVKCPGAPQKICYVVDHYLRKQNKRGNANIMYNTALPVIFGVKKYADALWKVCRERDIMVTTRTNLVELNPDTREAIFENLDKPEDRTTIDYCMIHVTPPMSTPDVLKKSELVNEAGFVDVDKGTLQSTKFCNVFAIGDCSSSPNSKTAAAAAAQSPVVYKNMTAMMKGHPLLSTYDGYASCPLVTGYDSCILAEFDYNLAPLETFPFNQARELRSMFVLKKELMPHLYWHLMMNGYWNGPAGLRKLLHLNLV